MQCDHATLCAVEGAGLVCISGRVEDPRFSEDLEPVADSEDKPPSVHEGAQLSEHPIAEFKAIYPTCGDVVPVRESTREDAEAGLLQSMGLREELVNVDQLDARAGEL